MRTKLCMLGEINLLALYQHFSDRIS